MNVESLSDHGELVLFKPWRNKAELLYETSHGEKSRYKKTQLQLSNLNLLYMYVDIGVKCKTFKCCLLLLV